MVIFLFFIYIFIFISNTGHIQLFIAIAAVMFSQIPEKQMREWKELLLHGLPLYESTDNQQPEYELSTDPVELQKQEILNNQDYDEYTVSVNT